MFQAIGEPDNNYSYDPLPAYTPNRTFAIF